MEVFAKIINVSFDFQIPEISRFSQKLLTQNSKTQTLKESYQFSTVLEFVIRYFFSSVKPLHRTASLTTYEEVLKRKVQSIATRVGTLDDFINNFRFKICFYWKILKKKKQTFSASFFQYFGRFSASKYTFEEIHSKWNQ